MRSEAQKAADKRYKAAHKAENALFQAAVKTAELKEIEELLTARKMTKAAFVRWATEELKKQ